MTASGRTKEEWAVQAIRNRERGLCGCGRELKPGRKQCQHCANNSRDGTKARRKLPGHCKGCGRADQPRNFCERCRERRRLRAMRRRHERRAAGLCAKCLRLPEPGKTLCPVHAKLNRSTYHRKKARAQ